MIWRAVGWLLCLIGAHDWTSKFQEGIKPNMEEVKGDPVKSFWAWSSQYCRRCGYQQEEA